MYHPKGEMCLVCKHLHKNCSGLPFKEMRVLEKYTDKKEEHTIVKCVQFSKESK